LLATTPNQLRSWDIPKLRGAAQWAYLYLYVILAVFSRYVIGWIVAQREGAGFVSKLIGEICQEQIILPGQLTIPPTAVLACAADRCPFYWLISASPRPIAGPTIRERHYSVKAAARFGPQALSDRGEHSSQY
jgi:hypothetical protein